MIQDDMALVREYAASQSEPAFAKLVDRYIGLVHSAALRRVGDPQLAEEVTQAVFILLARKAGGLKSRTILSGWLYRTAGYVAADALKTQRRRQLREQEAYMQSIMNEAGETPGWRDIAPLLESAMDRLSDHDRNVLLLRFFEERTLAEVGAAMGVSEDAARVRVHRALEKLHGYFARHGISSTTAMLAGAVAANSVQLAPAGLAKTISTVAAAKGAAAGTSTLTLVKGTLKIMAWTKMKTAAAVAVVVLLGAGSTVPLAVHSYRAHSTHISAIHVQGRMRTAANDNYLAIDPNLPFVTVELWKQFDPVLKWRVEKPGRVAVMDGESAILWLKPANVANRFPGTPTDAFDTYWISALATTNVMAQEMANARGKKWPVESSEATVAGHRELVLTITADAGVPADSNLKGQFINTTDRREVYQFDARTKRLNSVQIYAENAADETLIFEATNIDYNPQIDAAKFHLDLPADVAWYQEPQKVKGPDRYASLSADEAARTFFDACSRSNWTEVANFWYGPVNNQFKEYLGGLKIINLGAAYTSKPYPGRFVPYEIQLRPQAFLVRVANTNAAGRYVIYGTYDAKFQPTEPLNWPTAPAALPKDDPDGRLAPAEVVNAYFKAMRQEDWNELAKFSPDSDVAQTKAQVADARKNDAPLPDFEVGEAVWSAEQNSYFVKCTMSGTKKFRMAIRNDNPAKHWIVDGGI